MEENIYKENLMEPSSVDQNRGDHRTVSSHGASDEYGGILGAKGMEDTSRIEGFLYIPVRRLVLLSMLTFGVYSYYWQYRNWAYVKEREGLSISPFWRA